jgi:cytoskeleton protein RodZ
MSLSETENVAHADRPTGASGTVLGQAREAQGLSVADVARQLKLSIQQVEALEAGEYDRLPGPVFVRGFIRNYARLLKLDSERLVHSAATSMPQEEPRPAAPPSHDIPFPAVAARRWPKYAVAIAAALIALSAYEFYPSEPRAVETRSASAPSPASVAPSDAPGPQSGAPAAPQSGPGTPGPAAEAVQAVPPAAPAGTARSGTQDAAATLAPGAPDPAPSTLPGSGEHEIRMVFHQESWVEIRDRSGKAIFSQLNRRGTEKRVNGKPPLSVIVGNSHGVQLTYDDQPVDLARHTKVDVARLVLE